MGRFLEQTLEFQEAIDWGPFVLWSSMCFPLDSFLIRELRWLILMLILMLIGDVIGIPALRESSRERQ